MRYLVRGRAWYSFRDIKHRYVADGIGGSLWVPFVSNKETSNFQRENIVVREDAVNFFCGHGREMFPRWDGEHLKVAQHFGHQIQCRVFASHFVSALFDKICCVILNLD